MAELKKLLLTPEEVDVLWDKYEKEHPLQDIIAKLEEK